MLVQSWVRSSWKQRESPSSKSQRKSPGISLRATGPCPPLNKSLGQRGVGRSDWHRPGSPVPSLELMPEYCLLQPLRSQMGEQWVSKPLFLDAGRMAVGAENSVSTQVHRICGLQIRSSHFQISCYTITHSFPLSF